MRSITRRVHAPFAFLPAAAAVAVALVAPAPGSPVFASPGAHAPASPAVCRPLRGAETVQAAARLPCVRVSFGRVWYVDLRGTVLEGTTGVSAAQVPDAVVWLADASSTVPAGRTPGFTLYRTADRPQGGNVASSAQAYATLPGAVRSATIADAGDGVAVVLSLLRDGKRAVWIVSYAHPDRVREMLTAPASTTLTAAVRRNAIVVWSYRSSSHGTPTATVYVSHVTGDAGASVHTYRGSPETTGWYLDGLRVGGRAVPGIAPLPFPPIPGFRAIHVGSAANTAPALEVPSGWTVRPLPGGSSVGVEATDRRDRAVRVTVWRNACVGCYAEDPLGLVQGPDTPTAGLAPGAVVQWVGDHAIRFTVRRRVRGQSYVETVLVTVPPEQGTWQVSVTVPAADPALAERILSTFRWS